MNVQELLSQPATDTKCLHSALRGHMDLVRAFDYEAFEYLENDRYQVVTERAKAEIIHYANFDGRRDWECFRVLFDDKPVLIGFSGGRDGDEYTKTYIVDRDAYKALSLYMVGLAKPSEEESDDDRGIYFISLDDPRDDIDDFYTCTLAQAREFTSRKERGRILARKVLETHPELEGHQVLVSEDGAVKFSARHQWEVENYAREHGMESTDLITRVPGALAPKS